MRELGPLPIPEFQGNPVRKGYYTTLAEMFYDPYHFPNFRVIQWEKGIVRPLLGKKIEKYFTVLLISL